MDQSPQSEHIIELKGVCLKRGAREVFKGVDMKVPRGKIVGIMGPSGTGKTTLLKLISGLVVPDAGQVFVEGHDMHALSMQKLFTVRQDMALLFQSGALFTHLNVFDNVAFPLREHTALSEGMVRDLVLLCLETVGLRGAHQLMPSELSGGMARRAALARAVVLSPKLMLYDEPLAGQDPISVGVLLHLMRELNDALGLTSIIVSHDIAATEKVADEIFVLADGYVAGHGDVESIMKSDSAQVKQFMQGLPDGPVPFHYPAMPLAEDLSV